MKEIQNLIVKKTLLTKNYENILNNNKLLHYQLSINVLNERHLELICHCINFYYIKSSV